MEQKDPAVDAGKLKQPQWPLHVVYTAANRQIAIHIGEEVRPPKTAEEELYVLDRNFSVIVNSVAAVVGFLTKAGFPRQQAEAHVWDVIDGNAPAMLADQHLPARNWTIHLVELMHSKQVNIYRDKTVPKPQGNEEERTYMWFELRILAYCLANQMAILINNGVPLESMVSATKQVIEHYLNTGATGAETKKIEVKMFADSETKPNTGEFWVIKLVNKTNSKTGWVVGDNEKGVLLAVAQNNTLPAAIKQFETEAAAYRYMRDKNLNKSKDVSCLIISSKQLTDSDFKNVLPATGNEYFLQDETGNKVFYNAVEEHYYLANKDIGYCCWKKEEAEKAAAELTNFFGKKIQAVAFK